MHRLWRDWLRRLYGLLDDVDYDGLRNDAPAMLVLGPRKRRATVRTLLVAVGYRALTVRAHDGLSDDVVRRHDEAPSPRRDDHIRKK